MIKEGIILAHDVFISYTTEDKFNADPICFKLKKLKLNVGLLPEILFRMKIMGNQL